MAATKSKRTDSFDVEKYLNNGGIGRTIVNCRKGRIIFSQGDHSQSVLYLQKGRVKLTVTSSEGKDAIVRLLYPGEFFGEGCIAGQPLRVTTAMALEPTFVLLIGKQEMIRVIHEEHRFSNRFIAHMLKRNIRIEEDLTDQLFNFSEKRLARALLLIARYGKEEQPEKVVPKISQEMLADMIGTTRTHVSSFMNKFRKAGYIKYNSGLKGLQINSSLLRVVLDDQGTLRSTPAA
jgi:CRP/FNR family cyclic AMP-dependent transcriptional regulator